MKNRRATGAGYELRAASYLEARGFRILERNFRSRTGEIDIIAQDGDTLVFAEVKYRSSGSFGAPEEAVDGRKQERIRRTSDYYILTHGVPEGCPVRFDVIGIMGGEIRHIKDAFPYR